MDPIILALGFVAWCTGAFFTGSQLNTHYRKGRDENKWTWPEIVFVSIGCPLAAGWFLATGARRLRNRLRGKPHRLTPARLLEDHDSRTFED